MNIKNKINILICYYGEFPWYFSYFLHSAESIGLKSVGAKLTVEQLINNAHLPAILHWDQQHFVVLTPGSTKNKLLVADPQLKTLFSLGPSSFYKTSYSPFEYNLLFTSF